MPLVSHRQPFNQHHRKVTAIQPDTMNGRAYSDDIDWLMAEGAKVLSDFDDGKGAGTLRLTAWQQSIIENQIRFRKRAAGRIPNPEQWIWTDKSLAQASDWASATFKASLFPEAANVLDACCGAGVDLYALSRFCNSAIGIDNCPDVVRLCNLNMIRLSAGAEAKLGSFEDSLIGSDSWIHVDPDRREAKGGKHGSGAGRKTIIAEEFSPPWSLITASVAKAAGAIAKLSPKTTFDDDLEPSQRSHQSVWLGNRNECRQQLAIWGGVREEFCSRYSCMPHERVACLIEEPFEDRSPPGNFHFVCGSETHTVASEKLRSYVFDLHPTLHAAGLASQWADQQGLAPLTDARGYFSGDQPIKSPWAQCFEVKELLSWDDRKIRKCLRRHGAGHVEVKNRLHRMDANVFQKRLSKPEGEPHTILVTRMGDRVKAIVAKRHDFGLA